MVISMRQSGLAHNSISSYLRVFRTFLNWARKAGYTELEMANYKDKETVKETYTDAELMLLLQKPARNCDFCEYRNWVIINFLVNCGCRAGTIRNIQNRDVDFERKQVIFRHTKTGKIQTIPLCSMLVSILSDYVAMRGGEPSDYLFCSVYGTMLSENALKLEIADYNHKRGVLKTSIHMFRHTFARKYLMDCGGDAFTLQHLLGHSTLQMTKHVEGAAALRILSDNCKTGMGTVLRAWNELEGVASYCSGRGGSSRTAIDPTHIISMGKWWEELAGQAIENF